MLLNLFSLWDELRRRISWRVGTCVAKRRIRLISHIFFGTASFISARRRRYNTSTSCHYIRVFEIAFICILYTFRSGISSLSCEIFIFRGVFAYSRADCADEATIFERSFWHIANFLRHLTSEHRYLLALLVVIAFCASKGPHGSIFLAQKLARTPYGNPLTYSFINYPIIISII